MSDHSKRYESEPHENGGYWGTVTQYRRNVKVGTRRVTGPHPTADEAARAAYALFPVSVKDPKKGWVDLSFEEANQ